MPLLWKKRNQKTNAVAEEANRHKLCAAQDELTVSATTTNSDGIVFVFVIHDFAGTVSDELSVGRGQIVQQLYDDKTWSYVRNVDGRLGYIPASVTCSIDDIQNRVEWSSVKVTSRKPKIMMQNSNCLNGASSIQYSSIPSHSAVSSVRLQPSTHCSTRVSNESSNQEMSAITDLSASPRFIPRLHPLHPLSLCKSMSGRSTSTSKHDTDSNHQPSSSSIDPPLPPPLSVHLRTQSYQEAVTDHEPVGQHIYNVPLERHCRPHNLPLRLNGLLSNNFTSTNTTSNCTTGLRTVTTTHDSQLDDVFLPSNNKPIGIYRSSARYDKTVPGEVSLRRNEYVIVTEMGESEWAWVIAASGNEGVVPKTLLTRYDPSVSQRLDTVGTQTELVIVAPTYAVPAPPVSRQLNVTSYPREIAVASFRSEDCRTSLPRTEVAVQTDHMSPAIMDVWSQSQTIDEFWYENSMSIPRLNGFSFGGADSPSICTLPTINGTNDGTVVRGSRRSLPHLPVFSTLQSKNSSTAEATTIPLDSNSSFSTASDTRPSIVPQQVTNNPQTIVLKVTKSYIPDAKERDRLLLNKGDILHIYSGNNTVHKNWVWAYHMEQGIYGFVPKSHTAFLCVTNFRHVNGGIIRYDEV